MSQIHVSIDTRNLPALKYTYSSQDTFDGTAVNKINIQTMYFPDGCFFCFLYRHFCKTSL